MVIMFITLEGIEGSGKTTQISHIREFLDRIGRPCVTTREPGGTRIGQGIRSLLLDPRSKDLDSVAELLLYFADRAQHVRGVIKPALDAGKTVLCDRFFDATLVYQGVARGLDAGFVKRLHRLVFDDLKPDLTLLLDLPVETGLSRAWQGVEAGNRDGLETRFEQEAKTFHEKVRAGYLALAREEPSRFRVIDAGQDQTRVRDEILSTLSRDLGLEASPGMNAKR